MSLNFGLILRRLAVSLALCVVGMAQAGVYELSVRVDLVAPLADESALVFDWIDGGSPEGSVRISGLKSDGGPISHAGTGDVITGPNLGEAVLGDNDFFNEYVVTIGPFSWVQFDLDMNLSGVDPGSFPDGLSVFVMDTALTTFLVETNEVLGTNSILYADSVGAYTGYSTDVGTISVSTISNVPEPGSMALLALGLLGIIIGRNTNGRVK